MNKSNILISIRPEYANKIFEGTKTVELRRIRPKHIKKGSLVLIYVSSPVQSLSGAFMIDEVIEQPINELWKRVHSQAGVTLEEFNSYYTRASTGIGIFFSEVWSFKQPINLQSLKERMENFRPPQSFRYVTDHEMELASNQLPDLAVRTRDTQEQLMFNLS